MDHTDILSFLDPSCTLSPEAVASLPEEIWPLLATLKKKQTIQDDMLHMLRSEVSFLQEAFRQHPNPVFIKDDTLRFVLFSHSYADFFGMEPHRFLGAQVGDLPYLPPEYRRRFQEEDANLLQTQGAVFDEIPFQTAGSRKADTFYWSKGFISPYDDRHGVVGEVVDVSELKQAQINLKEHAMALDRMVIRQQEICRHDPLTQLHNRYTLKQDVARLFLQLVSGGIPVCGFLIDIDDFKRVNDTFGHGAGDDALIALSDIMRATFRQDDILLRYGGDEFASIMSGITSNIAVKIAHRLLARVRANLLLPDGSFVTLSIGVAQAVPGEDISAFFSRVDKALYAVKEQGKNGVSLIDGEGHARLIPSP